MSTKNLKAASPVAGGEHIPSSLPTLRVVGDGSSAIACLESALNDSSFSDVTFVVQQHEFHAHRCILAARSEVFRAMLFGPHIEARQEKVIIEDMNSDNFYTILHWAYTGKAAMSARDVLGVLKLANFYQFADLEKLCRDLALGFVDTANVLALFDAAIDVGEADVIDASLKFIAEHAADTIQQPSWLTLCKTGVEHVLSLPVMDVSEEMLFDRTVDWIDHNTSVKAERSQLLSDLLGHVRFARMSVHHLLEVVKPRVSEAGIQKQYVEALEFKLSPEHFAKAAVVAHLQPRVPTILQRIARNISISFLEGWTRVVEQDGQLPLPDGCLDNISLYSYSYICCGERMRSSNIISILAVGNVDIALRKTSGQSPFFPDGGVYWCNTQYAAAFGFSSTTENSPFGRSLTTADSLHWPFMHRGMKPGMDPAVLPSAVPQVLSEKIRFVFVK